MKTESARTMLARHLGDNAWSEDTLLLLIADWLDLDDARLASLSDFLNDVADTEREAQAEESEGDAD